MQTLLTSAQMRTVDEFTIANLPIASIDLMEKAARAFVQHFLHEEFDTSKSIGIFCGKGNNGGDGLAIAHLLLNNGYKNIKVYVANFSAKESQDFKINLQRLNETGCKIQQLDQASEIKSIKADLIIDAILGSGLNKPLSGEYEALVAMVNATGKKIYSVDTPTGFFTEGQLPNPYNGIKAYKTISFQRPKINFFFPESAAATAQFEVVEIGLDEDFIQKQKSDFSLLQEADLRKMLKPRKSFSHKGTYGHVLLVAGSQDTMGAALLASMASLHTGAGLTTACIPEQGLTALNTVLPEVMALVRDEYTRIEHPAKYSTIAIGPGLGVSDANEKLLEDLILSGVPLVIDADGLNMLSNRTDLIDQLSPNTILTPHMKEFDRLFGTHTNWWERVQTARKEARRLKIIIVLKNEYTFICLPDGNIVLNPTGNPAMAQGGMGDVLTGIITALHAQRYSASEAALLGCYLHGKAGDHLAKSTFVVSASALAKEISAEIRRALD